jgi:peptidoglycan-associated lipoprotein
MRVLLVLALIPLLAACSVFSSSEPPASLADTPPAETVAGATDSTGVPTGETSPSDATLTPTSTATSTPSGTSSPTGATPTASSAPTDKSMVPAPAAPPAAKAPAATAMPAPVNPPPFSPSVPGTDISGKWVGSWVGSGLFNAPRQENLTLEIVQKGDSGYGRMVLDNATAAESVPWQIRMQGLGGIRVFAEIDGSKVKLVHEQDDRLFTANMVVMGDQMIGEVKGRKVRLLLARQARSNAPARDVPPQAAQLTPPPVVASQPVVSQLPPVAMAPAPQAQEPDKPKAEPPAQRPRNEDYVAVPELKSLFFDFDKSVLRPDAVDALSSNLTWLKDNADTFVLIEGNADERGTAEYNLALGDRRAKSTQEYLEANGITKDRMSTVSYGKERPSCTDATEECRAQNRRSDFRIKSK